ncbi:MAG: response regulator [Verrucomicrobiales bacterium]|nr:response regulator [Verrucomicrobiales bacterium]
MSNKILTIDDSKTIRMIIQRAFRTHDCVFCEAANGEEGLAVAAREKPDLIILDITMPVMDGITMLGKLRQSPDLKGTPVIMLTAESGRDNVLNVSQLGISDYLVKPFKEEQLLEKASKVIALQLKAAA